MSHSTPEATPSGGGHENKLRSVPRAPDGPDGTAADGPDGYLRREFTSTRRSWPSPGARASRSIAPSPSEGTTTASSSCPSWPIQSDVRGRQRLSDQDDVGRTVHTNIDGQVNELRNLVRTLTFVAIGGLLLALGLGLFLARTALRPLEEVTNEIERSPRPTTSGIASPKATKTTRSTPARIQPAALVRGKQPDPAAPVGRGRQS